MKEIWAIATSVSSVREILGGARKLADEKGLTVRAVYFGAEQEADGLFAAGAQVVTLFPALDGHQLPEVATEQLAALAVAHDVALIMLPANRRTRPWSARLAAALSAGCVTDCQGIQWSDGTLELKHNMYGGAGVLTESAAVLPVVATIPGGVMEPYAGAVATGVIERAELTAPSKAAVVEAVEELASSGVDITAAASVVGIGRGVANEGDLPMINDLASLLGAEVGCTRPVSEDMHFLPSDRYIGLSGKTIRPQLYVGIGASGQIQHVAGVRDAKVIVSINNDEHAPIFDASDYYIVGDLYTVVPMLIEKIKQVRTEAAG